MKLAKLFPEDTKNYHGPKLVVVILIVLSAISAGRSLVHIFLPDGGTSSIAGIISASGASGPLIYSFAWAGIYQLIWAGVEWVILLKYRGLVPLLSLFMLFEQVALFLLPYYKPTMSGNLAHIPPEAIGNRVLLPLMVVIFTVSIFHIEKNHKEKG